MIYWTGRGFLAVLMFLGFGVACLMIVTAFDLRGVAAAVTFAALYVLLGTPFHWRIGTRINTRRTPGGDERHDENFFMSVPMQYWAVWYPVCALVALGLVAVAKDAAGWAWAIGAVGIVGLAMYGRWVRGHFDKAHSSGATEGQFLFGHAQATAGAPGSRRRLAAAQGWRYQEDAAPQLRERWYGTYGRLADSLVPTQALAGEMGGLPFTVFDTMVHEGRRSEWRGSRRTVCLVHLPVSLPDVRLRARMQGEELLAQLDPPLRVADEPPWNCDLLPRMSALAMIAAGDPNAPLVAEADAPGLADALVTADVRRETFRHRLPGWRVHGRDLVYVSLPGPGAGLSTDEAIVAVAGLVAVARSFPADALRRYGQPPTTGVPLAGSASQLST